MKTLLVGILAAGLAQGAHAAEAEAKIRVDKDTDAKVETRGNLEVDRRERESRVYEREQKIRAENRSSQLVGMEIWNHKDQKLGVIKDVVLDLNSGKVSYVVLGAGGFLGFREKLIAIPPGEFTRHSKESVLVLDTDPTTLDRMPGFAATNWPLEGDADWGPEAFTKMKAKYQNRSTDEGASVQVEADLDRDRESLGRPATSESATKARVYEDSKSFRGEVTSVDQDGLRLTVRDADGERKVFRVEAAPTDAKALSRSVRDFRAGDEVQVSYHTDASGNMIAHRVIRTADRD